MGHEKAIRKQKTDVSQQETTRIKQSEKNISWESEDEEST